MTHVTVCICTFRRRTLLRRLLCNVVNQNTNGRFTFSVVVVDNDLEQSAKSIVEDAQSRTEINIEYRVENRRGIPLARNKALEDIKGDFVAFVDDDEMPTAGWLLTLIEICDQYRAAGVVGTTKPEFVGHPPAWVVHGRFYDRFNLPTGSTVEWTQGRTGNVLFKKMLFDEEQPAFRQEFLSGEDQDFFRRMIAKGHRFVWCGDVLAYEVISPERWTRSFMLKKALLQGFVGIHDPAFGAKDVAKSMCAATAYMALLPITLVLGQHYFMRYSVKLFHHFGRLLGALGIKPIKAAYVTG